MRRKRSPASPPCVPDAVLLDILQRAPRRDEALLGAPAHTRPSVEPQEPAGLVSCRDFRRCSRGGHRMGRAQRRCLPGRVLFEDVFAGNSLNRNHWNPYICDNNSRLAMAYAAGRRGAQLGARR